MRQIRLMEEGDFPAVEDIYRRVIGVSEWFPKDERQKLDLKQSTEGEKIYVAVDEHETILGFISIWEAGSFIHHLYVQTESQRQNVGANLLESLDCWLPKTWQLKCIMANEGALRFYLGQGFVSISANYDEAPPYVLLQRSEA
jgi:GNAT superfamily N-acetyltransferase